MAVKHVELISENKLKWSLNFFQSGMYGKPLLYCAYEIVPDSKQHCLIFVIKTSVHNKFLIL